MKRIQKKEEKNIERRIKEILNIPSFGYFVNFTTGFGLRPAPAAIIVMTPSGSGKEKLYERLQTG